MLKPHKKSKVTDCHMPNGNVCNECENYEICIADNKVKDIKPAIKVVEEELNGEKEN